MVNAYLSIGRYILFSIFSLMTIITKTSRVGFPVLAVSYLASVKLAKYLQGSARLANPDYAKFIHMKQSRSAPLHRRNDAISKENDPFYDYELVNCDEIDYDDHEYPLPVIPILQEPIKGYKNMLIQPVSYILGHTIGLWMIYPGSTYLLNLLFKYHLTLERSKLIRDKNAQRYVLRTHLGDLVDCVYIARSKEALIITSEGNGSFYEAGMASVARDHTGTNDASVLSWNHLGFAASQGKPYIRNEQAAIIAVVRFAEYVLNHAQDSMTLYSWSIGGYVNSFAYNIFPNIGGIVLDAAFDELLPLAASKMPSVILPIITPGLTQYFNLNVKDNLYFALSNPDRKYKRFILVRRIHDEMISTGPDRLATNRINHLAYIAISAIFPNWKIDRTIIITLLSDLVTDIIAKNNIPKEKRDEFDKVLDSQTPPYAYAPHKSDECMFLSLIISRIIIDYDSTHCVPLSTWIPPLTWGCGP